MAFYPVIRKASTYVTPLVSRAIGVSRVRICSIDAAKIIDSCRTNPSPNLESYRVNPLLHFSTASIVVEKKKKKKKRFQSDDLWDRDLIRVLNSEIKCVIDSDLFTIAVDVPTGFPFKVEDNAGGRTIVLTREFEGEHIRIEVDMPSKDGASDGDDEREMVTSIPVVVTVSKSNVSRLEFGARCLPDGFSVLHLSLKKSGNSGNGIAYTGPNFLKLNEYLRNAFLKYLETRGLTSSMANFLFEYMMFTVVKDPEKGRPFRERVENGNVSRGEKAWIPS